MTPSRLSIVKWVLVAGSAGAATAYLLRGRNSPAPGGSIPPSDVAGQRPSPAGNGVDPTDAPAALEGGPSAAADHDGPSAATTDTSGVRGESLAEKVRREVLTQERWRPYTIDIEAAQGDISLRGQLDRPDQIHEFVDLVSAVEGVERIDNFLHLPGTDPPSLEEARKAGMRRQ